MIDLDDALDRYTVPKLGSDFADRVVAKAVAIVPLPAARDRRGSWKRGRTILFGIGAFSLMSAAAAATGVFGDVAKDVPVIGKLIASVAPAKPKTIVVAAKHKAKLVELETMSVPKTVTVVETVPPASHDDISNVQDRRAVRMARVDEHIARRQARRAENGLPPLTEHQARMARRMAMMPLEARAEVKARIAARIDAEGGLNTLTRDQRRSIIRDEMQSLRRERRMQREQGMADPLVGNEPGVGPENDPTPVL